ncbi:MAG: polysaccharide deacetylase family protein [Acidobacteria bacterium]|nr:polysaccharide deacetylase family protein [Acidobacteriota bacterium]
MNLSTPPARRIPKPLARRGTRTLFPWLFCTFFAAAALAEGAPPAPRGAEGKGRVMVVTVDDLVGVQVPGGSPADFRAMTETLLGKLKAADVPATGFVNMAKTRRDGRTVPELAAILDLWLDAGMELGNHTFSHPSLHAVSPEVFEKDVVLGEEGLREAIEARGGRLRYFRHPCLHTGRSLEVRQRVNDFLAARGYTVAPVTVDNGEWIYASAYRCCFDLGDLEGARRIREDYLGYMLRKVAYFEDQSRKLFDREVPQVLLVHANALNAHCIDRLLAGLRERGYDFVPLADALADPAYASADTFTGRGGISWLHRWALSRGCKRDFFGDEPEVPRWVCEIAGVEGE